MSTHIMQIKQIQLGSTDYPQYLSEISSPPPILYLRGELPSGPYIAIVGTRKLTRYGEQITYQLAYELAKAGIVIVSGLAIGIDAVAHRAALDAGGKTVAVLAHGLEKVSPIRNLSLAHDIIDNGGAIVSEYPEGTITVPHNFAIRNRIISGLSLGAVITEADAESGSLITAKFALKQDRLVFAVPGNITQPRSAGPNNLLRDGAVPVTSSSDILQTLNFTTAYVPDLPITASSPQEATIIELLKAGESTSQLLIEATGMSASDFANVISLMEITGRVQNLGAGHWATRTSKNPSKARV